MADFYTGTTINLDVDLRDVDGEFVDPDGLSVFVLGPDGTSETFVYLTDSELTRKAEGQFRLAYVAHAPGPYKAVPIASGALVGRTEIPFLVRGTVADGTIAP